MWVFLRVLHSRLYRLHTEHVSASSVVPHFPVLFLRGWFSSDSPQCASHATVSDTLPGCERIPGTLYRTQPQRNFSKQQQNNTQLLLDLPLSLRHYSALVNLRLMVTEPAATKPLWYCSSMLPGELMGTTGTFYRPHALPVTE